MAALRHIESTAGVEQSIPAMLKSKNWKTRLEAVNLLSQYKDKKAIDLLLPLLHDSNKQVRFAAVKALGTSGDMGAFDALIAQLRLEEAGLTHIIARALENFGEQAEQRLLDLLNDPSPTVRATVVEVLGNLGSTRAVVPLIERLKDEDEPTRRFAAFALGNLGDTLAVEPLIRLLQDPSEDVRWVTADALGNLGDKRAVEPLLKALDDCYASVNYSVTEALTKLLEPSEVTIDFLVKLSQHNSPDVRYWAVVGLGSAKTDLEDAISTLEQIAANDTEINQYGDSISEATTQSIAKIKESKRS